ncbi:MAG: class I SAM-dependent methyltransferase, partial [Candidatus Desulforudis sp.]|nr:class I SAM-dependent methyltransferase [Desulforudis sp.]
VVSRRRMGLVYAGREFFFHPGLAKLRIREIMAGKTDQMVKAMDLQPGDRVLDCTLGLAADALVAGYAVGDRGRVTGLEAVPVLALLISCGLEDHRFHSGPLGEAMRRVKVLTADHREYLVSCETGGYDVVYFDPMFRVPRLASSGMEPLRLLAESTAVGPEAVREAVRVARRRVVLKERRDSSEFPRLGFERVEGGRYSPVAYGVIEKGGGPG